jgi:hypothetical protein
MSLEPLSGPTEAAVELDVPEALEQSEEHHRACEAGVEVHEAVRRARRRAVRDEDQLLGGDGP